MEKTITQEKINKYYETTKKAQEKEKTKTEKQKEGKIKLKMAKR